MRGFVVEERPSAKTAIGVEARGIDCTVAALARSSAPRRNRIKTDRRDAERLVRLLVIGGCTPSAFRVRPRRRCATSSAPARTSAADPMRARRASPSSCCATICASRGTTTAARSAERRVDFDPALGGREGDRPPARSSALPKGSAKQPSDRERSESCGVFGGHLRRAR